MSLQLVNAGIKTNLITGDARAGKTACILQLLDQKPPEERWAILVNKFGAVSLNDNQLQAVTDANVYCKILQGGCICCSFGLQLQTTLNQLLVQSNPHRLLIELPAVADSDQVVQLLSQPWFKKLLTLNATVTVVDGRASVREKYHSHLGIKSRLTTTDILLFNKADLTTADDKAGVLEFRQNCISQKTKVHLCEQGKMPLAWLDAVSSQLPLHH